MTNKAQPKKSGWKAMSQTVKGAIITSFVALFIGVGSWIFNKSSSTSVTNNAPVILSAPDSINDLGSTINGNSNSTIIAPTINAAPNSSSHIGPTINGVSNWEHLDSPSIVSGPNSINTIGQSGGSNTIIINSSPDPIVLTVIELKKNVLTNGVYKSLLMVEIGYPSSNTVLYSHIPSAISTPEILGIGGGQYMNGDRTVPMKHYHLSVLTSQPLLKKDEIFSVTNEP